MASRIVGIDFGRDSIRAVEVENADKAKPVVTRYHALAVPEGALRSGEVRELNTVTSAVRKLWSAGGFTSKNVVLGMANQRVLVRDLAMPKMSLVQIREALPFQVQDMLPVPVAEALLDFYPISEGTSDTGPVVNGLLVAAIKESVLANVNAVRQAGLNVKEVDLIPFALHRVLVRGPLVGATVALIDIGSSTTNVVVSSQGVPQFVRIIPMGGYAITQAISNRLEVTEEQAESIKQQRGLNNSQPTSELDYASIEVIRTSALELLNSLRNTLNFFAGAHAGTAVQAIVLTGGGSRLLGLAQALGDMTRLQVIAADAFSSVEVSRSVKATVDPQEMTVALGLALGSAA